MNIYVGNLSFSTLESDLRQLFENYGTIQAVKVITDRESGKPRGFAFVEMDDAGAASAIEALDGHELKGRNISVNEARERKPGPPQRNRSSYNR